MNKYLTNKDIMQGDWLYPRNSNIPDKVFSIGKHVYMGGTTDCITFEKDINVHYYTFMCNPVPLTPEILEKNGFELKEEEIGMNGVTTVPHYFCKGVPFEVFCDGEPFAIWFKEPVNIKWVHELQNALRLCKIEKEIEL